MANPIITEISPGINYKVSEAARFRADLQLNLIITGDAMFDVHYPAADTPAFTLIQGSSSITLTAPVDAEQSSKEIPNRIVLWSTSDSAGVRNLHLRILDPTFITPSEIWTLRATGLSTDSSYALVMALNAMVVGIDAEPPEGRFPDTPESMVPPLPGEVDTPGRGLFFGSSGLNIFYDSGHEYFMIRARELVSFSDVFLAQVPLADSDSAAITPRRITWDKWDTAKTKSPCAVKLPNGEVLVVYQRQVITVTKDPDGTIITDVDNNICLKRGWLDTLSESTNEIDVDSTGGLDKIAPFAVVAANRVVFVWTDALTGNVRFNRFDPVSGAFTGPIQALSATHATPGTGVHAEADAAGVTWIVYPTPANIHVVQLPSSGGPTRELDMFDTTTPNVTYPIVMMDQNGNMWFFWTHTDGSIARVEYRRFLSAAARWDPPLNSPPLTVRGTESGANVITSAVAEPDGGVWIFIHASRDRDVVSHIFAVRFDPDLESWGPLHQLTDTTSFDVFPQAVRGPDEALWLVWRRFNTQEQRILYRRLITQV